MLRPFLLAALLPAIAHADPYDIDVDRTADSRVGVSVGGNPTTGPSIGFEITPVFARHLEVGLQGTLGFHGPEAMLMPRARLTAGSWTFTAGAGVGGSADGAQAKAEVGAQLTFGGGGFARLFVGDDHPLTMDSTDVPYLGLTFGKTL